MEYLPTKESVSRYKPPKWYQDAKLGIFIHWGLYSVPGWATKDTDFQEALRKHGSHYWFRNNAYAEWYWNSLKLSGSATRAYHQKAYGDDFHYEDFLPLFEDATRDFDAVDWARIFKKAGAKYAVLTTKHHEGYLLWDSHYPNPHRPDFQAREDLVGAFKSAMRAGGIRPGFYYSGGPDWIYDPRPVETLVDVMAFIPQDQGYADYVYQHYQELIARYQPDILWNDIGYPPRGELYQLLANFYNQNPEGVVNDRFGQMKMGFVSKHRRIRNLLNRMIESQLKKGIDVLGSNSAPKIGNFSTPEYTQLNEVTSHKWETCRGLGKSFGYNRAETSEDLISTNDLIRMFVDIVSKNGNLLINVGPEADGKIPDIQLERLRGLGEWLDQFGEAIFETWPWIRAEGVSLSGIPLRFTQKKDFVYIFVMDDIKDNKIRIPFEEKVKSVINIGSTTPSSFLQSAGVLEVDVGELEKLNSVVVLRIQKL